MASRIEKFTEGGEPGAVRHGTSSAYNYHKCRCDECVAWKKRTSREYYERNAEKVRQRNGAYARQNRQSINERVKRVRAVNPEKRREWERKNYAKDPERHYRKQRAWEDKNSWRVWFYGWHRRERERGQTYAPETLEWIKSLQGAECTYCNASAETIDHIHPRSRGGSNDRQNLAPSCHRCNKRKGSMDVDVFLKRHGRKEES